MELVGEFQETATGYARHIIDEYHVLGSKMEHCQKYGYNLNKDMSFSKHGIIFRFACDYDGN
jgi:hypothetical protein